MSNESCSTSPRLDYDQFLKDVTWVNEDYPEANMALLEGIRNGFTGYEVDKIIESQPAKRLKAQARGNLQPTPTTEELKGNAAPFDLETMEQVLRETRHLSPPPRITSTSPTGPLKRNSALTVRPTIGEERKAWLLEARRAYCLNELQSNRTLMSSSDIFRRSSAATRSGQPKPAGHAIEQASVSCPALQSRNESHHPRQQWECNSARSSLDIQDRESSIGSIDEKDSCEFLFQNVEGCFKPSKIRLSPRIEKLDKLIPKTSKEFLNTMRIVSTISPQPSEEQLSIHQSKHIENEIEVKNINQNESNHQCGESDEMEENHHADPNQQHHACTEADVSSANRLSGGNVCRSYKEVCIYGPHSTSTASGTNSASQSTDQSSERMTLRNGSGSNSSQSSSSFPKLVRSNNNFAGQEGQKAAPPLYSSILQRSPPCAYGCGDNNCRDNHHCPQNQISKQKIKTSPVSASSLSPTSLPTLGSFDCGFCRTNNEPESVYRSHPLRINDVVVCPSLRKYVCCFCGATGDNAHTIKYCPKNPIGFFAKKTRNSPVPMEKNLNKCLNNAAESNSLQSSPEKVKENIKDQGTVQVEHEFKSDSESAVVVDETFEPIKNTSGNWIEAKAKGRKKKGGK